MKRTQQSCACNLNKFQSVVTDLAHLNKLLLLLLNKPGTVYKLAFDFQERRMHGYNGKSLSVEVKIETFIKLEMN